MPEEFIKTNILGSINVKKAALTNEVPVVLSISTDKAVNPSNVMGLTKAIQEKIFSSDSINKNTTTKFINVRFGNVIGTAGSLFPIIYHQIKNKIPITITNPKMTRFFMSKNEAIDLILWASKNGKNGSTILKKMKAVNIENLVKTFIKVLNLKEDYPIAVIGTRVGEKLDEALATEDEILRLEEKDGYYVINPYDKKEISSNIIDKSIVENPNSNKFLSSSSENSLNEKELKLYIREYIKSEKGNVQYI
jgi:UDP-glucose 4-epimerase